MTAPEITVESWGGLRTVTMRDAWGDAVFADVHSDGSVIVYGCGGCSSITCKTIDLRRLADAIDAVRAGTWQPTPALPTGGAA